jgi:hypothetical protein
LMNPRRESEAIWLGRLDFFFMNGNPLNNRYSPRVAA